MEQLSLFETIAPVYTTIGNAAEQLQVSTATIRNWIKEDLFELSESKKLLSQESITQFKKNRVGKDKLNSRANKKNKDHHNHQKLTSKIKSEISKGNFIGNDLCVEYENALSDSYKNREGIFYTPSYIVERMLQSIDTTENKLFLEPCCGCGNFIIAAIQKGIDPQNVYGFDTDVNAVRITQKRIYDLTGYHSDKIVCANFLDIAKKMPQRFDYIFTNPPWGKKISKQAKDNYAKIYEAEESNDTCSLFFFACTKLLKEKGKLGFLLPEAFFNVAQFEKARKKALSFHIERITDYGKFGNLLTRAQSIILTNEQIFQKIVCEKEDKSYMRNHESFFHLPKHIINFYTTDFDATIVDYIYSIPHKTLRNNASWALGIVTGDNKNICKKEHGKGLVPIICGKDITKEGLKQPTLFIDERLEHCQQIAPRKYYLAEEKIIYRFISDKLTFYCDKGKNYILNSANLLIIDQNFPISSEQLVDLLNSELMTWLFQSIFRTHKILRSDLEQLPIFCDYFKQHNIFSEKFFLNYLNLEKKMELTELKNRIINAFNGTKQDLRLLLETVENDKEGIYPFNGFELLLSTCISNGNITYKKYRELRHEYFVNNPNLWIFEISAPRGFGEQFAQTFLRNKSSKLEIPNSRKDPNYHGQYDLWLDGIRIEVKASRVTDANSDSSVPLYKKALSHNTKQPFLMNFQQLKPQCCDVFVWMAVYRDVITIWIMNSQEVKQHPGYSKGQHRGNAGNEGQLHITDKNIKTLNKYILKSDNIALAITKAYKRLK